MGEELTISYVAHGLSFSERKQKFGDWIQPGVGFQCQCDWCHTIRSSPELNETEELVHTAYRKAADLVSKQGLKMAVAAEIAMPTTERSKAFKVFSQLPLALQHNACSDLWVMEGACEAHKGNMTSALVAYENAAKIKLAVRGGFSIERAKDLWRIVGASMACEDPGRAVEILVRIYREVFAKSSVSNVHEAFRLLTLHYSMPWWQDSLDMQKLNVMEQLIQRAIKESRSGTGSKIKKCGSS